MNRGALPLAILIVAALAAGIAVAVIKPGDLGEEKAGPQPTSIPTSIPTSVPTALPTTEPSPTFESPSPEPTEEPSPEPTDGGGNGGGGGDNGPALAETGGPVLPSLLGGALLMGAGVGLWRLRRRIA